MYNKRELIDDILKELNKVGMVILAGQNGKKPDMPYAEVNIVSEEVAHEFDEVEYVDNTTELVSNYKNNIYLTLSITHHSKDNLDEEINELADYFRSKIVHVQNKHNFSITSETNITNRNTVLSAEYDNIKGFDITLYIDDVAIDTVGYIESVEL